MIIGIFLNYGCGPVVVIGGEFILILFIEVMVAGCWLVWLLPRGGCFSEGLLIEVLL